MSNIDKPFFFYSENFPKTLNRIKATLVFSTYQAGKLIFISSLNGKTIIKYAKSFKRPMGIAIDKNKMKLAVASRTSIQVFASNKVLALSYPEKKSRYDQLFIPQVKYHTGYLDTHEIEFGTNSELYFINTMFSCISKVSADKHFEMYWKPDFITELLPEDRCHLNGMAMKNGKPAFVTMFDTTNTYFGWKKTPKETGLLVEVETGKTLLDQLAMPHSPVYFDDKIYFLLSGTGEIKCYDLKTEKVTLITKIDSFLRGMVVHDDVLIVGTSKLREETTTFKGLPFSAEDSYCGIYILNRTTGKPMGGISYTDNIREIFSLKLLLDVQVPGILVENDEYHDKSIMADPNLNFWIKQKKL